LNRLDTLLFTFSLVFEWNQQTSTAKLIAGVAGDIRWGTAAYSTSLKRLFLIAQSPCAPMTVCLYLTSVDVVKGSMKLFQLANGIDVSDLQIDDQNSPPLLYALIKTKTLPSSLALISYQV
jgi:hypothetical protein